MSFEELERILQECERQSRRQSEVAKLVKLVTEEVNEEKSFKEDDEVEESIASHVDIMPKTKCLLDAKKDRRTLHRRV